jgi:serine/threonine protein kinase
MSPQQVREMPLNHQTDIYSLGVVMYQLLAGRMPFQASNNYSLVYQIIHVDPPPPSAHRPRLPPALDAVVARAMQKDLALRYANWRNSRTTSPRPSATSS